MRKGALLGVVLTAIFVPCFVHADSTITSKSYVDSQFISNIETGATAGTLSVTKNGTTTNVTVNTPTMTGATSAANGAAGAVPAPNSADRAKYLRGDGTWADVAANPTVSQTDTGTGGYVVNSVAMDTTNPSQINVTRGYIKVPVSTGAPSSNNTPSGFVDIWFE